MRNRRRGGEEIRRKRRGDEELRKSANEKRRR